MAIGCVLMSLFKFMRCLTTTLMQACKSTIAQTRVRYSVLSQFTMIEYAIPDVRLKFRVVY